MRKCDNCGAALDQAEGAVVCKFCQTTNATPPREVKVPVPVQVVQQVVQTPSEPLSSARLCPHCHKRLAGVRVLEVDLSGCGGCGGIWIDNVGARKVLSSPDAVFAELATRAAKNATDKTPPRSPAPKCPTCQVGLDRVKAHGLELDVCAEHGTWFDAWELKRLVNALSGKPDQAIVSARDGEVACASCRLQMKKSAANISDRGPLCDGCWRTEQEHQLRAADAKSQGVAGGAALGGAVLVGALGILLAAGNTRNP